MTALANDERPEADASGKIALGMNYKELGGETWYQRLLGHYTGDEGYDVSKLDIYRAEVEIPRSDRYTAEAITAMFKNRVTYVVGAKEWHVWDSRIHVTCEGDAIANALVNMYSDQLKKALDEVKLKYEIDCDMANMAETDPVQKNKNKAEAMKAYQTVFKDHRRYRNMLDSTSGVKSVIEALKHSLAVPSDYYDNDRDWFVMRDGVVDVRASWKAKDIVLARHDPARPVFRFMDAKYNPDAEYPALQRFLDNSIADSGQARFLQKAFGSALIGAPEKTKTIIDAFGAPDSGKSMINGVLRTLAPDYCIAAHSQAITKGAKDADMFRDKMRLGRIISFSEVKAKLEKSFILEYTGGDPIETTRKYRNSITWVAQGLMIMMSNEGMNIGSQEQAVSDRIERINFPNSFVEDHPNPLLRKDATLKDQIIEQREGFLRWLLEGFRAHLQEDIDTDGKVKPTESMGLLKAEMQDATNTASIFWESVAMNKYERDRSAPQSKWVPLVTVIADYKKWCKMTEHPMMEEADVKAWMKREGLFVRSSGQNRLVEMVAKQGAVIGG